MGTTRNRTHGTGAVIARKNGTFTAQITDGGRRSIGTFPSRAAAEKALAVALVESPHRRLAPFGEYLTEWLADQSLQVKATTAARNNESSDPELGDGVIKIARLVRFETCKPEHFRCAVP